MIDLYTYGTFNGRQVSIMLEELGVKYDVHKIDLVKGEHKTPSFRLINPSARIPVIVDHDVSSNSPLVLSQTSAILIYLGEKHEKFLSNDIRKKAHTMQWLAFHATDVTTTLFNEFFLSTLVEIPQLEASLLLKEKALDFYQFFDQQLEQNKYLAGDEYSIADIAMFPAVSGLVNILLKRGYVSIYRWFKETSERAAVRHGMGIP